MKKQPLTLLSVVLFATGLARAQQVPPPLPRPSSPEVHSKQVGEKLEKDLVLNAAQKQKVEEAYKAFFTGIEKSGGAPLPPPPPPPAIKQEEMDKLNYQRDEQIKKVLSASQFKKYQEIEKTMRPPMPGGPKPPPPANKN